MKINLERIYKNKEELLKDIYELERNIPRKTSGNLSKNKKKEIKRIEKKLSEIITYVRIYRILNNGVNSKEELKEYEDIHQHLLDIYTKFKGLKKEIKVKKVENQYKREIKELIKEFLKDYKEIEEKERYNRYVEIVKVFEEKEENYPGLIEGYIIDVIGRIQERKIEKAVETIEQLKSESDEYYEYVEGFSILENNMRETINRRLKIFGERYLKYINNVFEEEKIEISDKSNSFTLSGFVFVQDKNGVASEKVLFHELGHYFHSKINSAKKDIYVEEAMALLNEYILCGEYLKEGKIDFLKYFLDVKYRSLLIGYPEAKIKYDIYQKNYTDYEEFAVRNRELLNKYYKIGIFEENRYRWVVFSSLINNTNNGVYIISNILAINIYIKFSEMYKEGEEWSDIYKIAKFRKIDDLIEYLGYSAKANEDKEEAIEKMHEKAIEYIEKQIEVL